MQAVTRIEEEEEFLVNSIHVIWWLALCPKFSHVNQRKEITTAKFFILHQAHCCGFFFILLTQEDKEAAGIIFHM